MIWQENSHAIVMVTGLKEEGKEKCTRYWSALSRCRLGAEHLPPPVAANNVTASQRHYCHSRTWMRQAASPRSAVALTVAQPLSCVTCTR